MSDKLITDRTPGDVQRETAKGFYNASDLNRVESAAGRLAALLRELPEALTAYGKTLGIDWKQARLGYDPAALALRTRTDWTLRVDLRALPSSLDRLTWSGANEIEACLERSGEARAALERRERDRLDRTAQAWAVSGERFAGEEIA